MGGGPGNIAVRPDEHGSVSSAAAASMSAAASGITDTAGLREEHTTAVNHHTSAGRATLASGQRLGEQAAGSARALGDTDTRNSQRFGGKGTR